MDDETRQILVVDDEEAICDLIKGALEARGYKVELAYNSAEAMKKLTTGHFHLAILDYLMPKGDGKFLYQQIEAMNPELARRILFITGASFEPRLIKFLSSANLRFLKKPFRIDDLVQAVQALG
jgi:two-component system NtrC family sensor kinase